MSEQPAAAEEAIDSTAEEIPATEPDVLDAVIVVKQTDDAGNISVSVATNGGVQATEVQTLLELAVPTWREKIGLPTR